MLDFLFRKHRLRRELESLCRSIDVKRAEVDAAEHQCHVAWGKKWSYIRMQRRTHEAANERSEQLSEMDGQGAVLEMRRQQDLAELRAKESELEALLAREKQLAAELGGEPATPMEAHGEKR